MTEADPDDSSQEPQAPEAFADRGWGGGLWMLGGVLALSTIMGVVFTVRYVGMLSHVRTTLQSPEETPEWELRHLSPDECVDEAMRWTQECRGVKVLCDEYATNVMNRCLGSADRLAYCEQVGLVADTTAFGHAECVERGVRRGLDAEGCSYAYRAIADFCGRTLLEDARARGEYLEIPTQRPR